MKQETTIIMKTRILILLLVMPFMAFGQSKQSLVKLKNGTELRGVIKSLDPMSSLVLSIGGVDTTIKMENVLRVEEETVTDTNNEKDKKTPILSPEDKLVVTDFNNYPESFDLVVGSEKIKMILVRGGMMNMGFDGRHSMSMKSEPVHKVTLTSFYMSETFVTSAMVNGLLDKKKKFKNKYYLGDWKKIENFVELIAEVAKMPVRLPTEAEWEYAASSPVQNLLFKECVSFEYCGDFYDDYRAGEAIDPTGPQKGSSHVCRAYDRKKGKYDRSYKLVNLDKVHFRLAIKVKDVIDKIR